MTTKLEPGNYTDSPSVRSRDSVAEEVMEQVAEVTQDHNLQVSTGSIPIKELLRQTLIKGKY